jgi:hypothetical protein
LFFVRTHNHMDGLGSRGDAALVQIDIHLAGAGVQVEFGQGFTAESLELRNRYLLFLLLGLLGLLLDFELVQIT